MLRKLLAAVFLLASAPLAQAGEASAGQISLIDRTCTQVMGLRPGETYFAICRQNLSDALPAAAQGQTLADAGDQSGRSFYEVSPMRRWDREQAACAVIGLHRGSTAFHQCAAGLDSAFLPSLN